MMLYVTSLWYVSTYTCNFSHLCLFFWFLFNITFQYINSFVAISFALKMSKLTITCLNRFFSPASKIPRSFTIFHYIFFVFMLLCFYVSILKIFKLPPRSVWAFPTCQPTPPKVNFESVGTKSCLLQYEITYFQTIRRLSV